MGGHRTPYSAILEVGFLEVGFLTMTYETALEAIVAGSNDYDDLQALYYGVEYPENDAEKRFKDFWEITGFIASDGFEWLFEQSWSFDDFLSIFNEIGFTEALPILEKVRMLIPDAIRTPDRGDEMKTRIRASFQPLEQLLNEYFDVADEHLNSKFAQFIRSHQRDFRRTER